MRTGPGKLRRKVRNPACHLGDPELRAQVAPADPECVDRRGDSVHVRGGGATLDLPDHRATWSPAPDPVRFAAVLHKRECVGEAAQGEGCVDRRRIGPGQRPRFHRVLDHVHALSRLERPRRKGGRVQDPARDRLHPEAQTIVVATQGVARARRVEQLRDAAAAALPPRRRRKAHAVALGDRAPARKHRAAFLRPGDRPRAALRRRPAAPSASRATAAGATCDAFSRNAVAPASRSPATKPRLAGPTVATISRRCSASDRRYRLESHVRTTAQIGSSTLLKCQKPIPGKSSSSTVSRWALVLSASLP